MGRTRCAASARAARGRRLPPAFRTHSTSGCPRCGLAARWHLAIPQAARVQSFFALLGSMEDTNLLHRGGSAGLHFAQEQAAGFIRQGGTEQPQWRERAAAVHRAFVARRLSLGGCADLLAITLFLDALDTRS
jgi:triphosphoribosyl-dephospho-CoA synthase